MTARRRALAIPMVGVLILGLGLAGCGDDGEPTTTDTAPATEADGGDEELSSYESIDALHQTLVDGGITCGLEYEGLRDEGREVSICVIAGEQALLTIWDDPALVDEFAASEAADSGDVAYGTNWTVDVDTPETARIVANALDGTVSGSPDDD